MALRRGQPPVAAPAPGAAQSAPVSFDPYRDPAAAAAYASTIRNQAPPPGPPPQAPAQPATPAGAAAAPPPGAPNPQAVEIFQQYGGLVLSALNNGTPGWQFADNVAGLLGNATHAMIANHGEDALVATMFSIPEFQVFGEQRLRTFVYEFIHFEEFGDDGEDEGIEPDQIDVSKVYQPRDRAAASHR